MRSVLAMVLLISACGHPQTGTRMKVVFREMGSARPLDAREWTATRYVLGPRSRTDTEQPGPNGRRYKVAFIQLCDARISYYLDLDRHEYRQVHLPPAPPPESAANLPKPVGAANIVIETTVRDTGETKSILGHSAHHYVTTTTQTPAPELNMAPDEVVEDEWYLDVPDNSTCNPRTHQYASLIAVGGSAGAGQHGGRAELPDIHSQFKFSGPIPRGLVVSQKRTTRTLHHLQTGERSDYVFTTSQEVVELSSEKIDPSLFEVPKGFKEVKQGIH